MSYLAAAAETFADLNALLNASGAEVDWQNDPKAQRLLARAKSVKLKARRVLQERQIENLPSYAWEALEESEKNN